MSQAVDDYDYQLPAELIAQKPLAHRQDARLMLIDRAAQSIDHFHVRDLPDILQKGDRLVLNDTRVVPAALAGIRTNTGGRWKGLFLTAGERGLWQILGKTRGKVLVGETITLVNRQLFPDIHLKMLAKQEGGVWLAKPESEENAYDILERVGRVPLPHYIRDGEMIDSDLENYQTVYAEQPGAVAAPTAGLHFTPELLQQLTDKGIPATRITLHVGVGTFRPISVDNLAEHQMHSEWARLSEPATIELRGTKASGGRIVAVGTTCCRTLETAARSGQLQPWEGETDLFIRPPFEFHAIDALLTNFHLPRSTLLVLVRTFGGDELMKRAYAAAVEEGYRFYSYGDAMLIV